MKAPHRIKKSLISNQWAGRGAKEERRAQPEVWTEQLRGRMSARKTKEDSRLRADGMHKVWPLCRPQLHS